MIQVVKEKSTDYNSFVSEITARVRKIMGEGYTVSIYKVIKNNSLELDSLVMLKEGKNFAPNIYLMPYYDSYLAGTSVYEIADRLCEIYQHCEEPIVSGNFTYSYEEMKPYIIYRLVSFERNHILLSKTPHIKYLDLAVTFHCLVRNDEEGIGTIRITNEHISMWKTSIDEISVLANKNTCKLFPSSIRSMEEVIKGLLQEEFTSNTEDDFPEDLFMISDIVKPIESIGSQFKLNNQSRSNNITNKQHKMFILSNQKGINGASCMLYEDVLCKFASQINSDFYILPSSIHEIILIPYQKDMKKETLTEMVKDVNRTQVAQDEILSDKVYLYSKEQNAILM